MRISLLTPSRCDEALAVVQDACDRLHEKNIQQWPRIFPRPYLERCLNNQEVWGVEERGTLVAIFRLVWSDPETWGPDDGRAGYVHTLAVHRSAVGKNLGRQALEFAFEEVIRVGRHVLRLDCVSHNTFLINYYTGLGFKFVRERTVRSTVVSLFEK
jgi:ribosomal protein S18 acetylase RimI-like enzyme